MPTETGFYWVLRTANHHWEVAYYSGEEWQFVNAEFMRNSEPVVVDGPLYPPTQQ